jgi:choice-of-anchor C domain-containing protein
MNISPSSSALLEDSITNSGTLNWRGGPIQIYNYYYDDYSYGIYNLAGAQFNILTDQSIYSSESYYGSYGFISNAGTVRKSGTTGATLVEVNVTNNGVLDVEGGMMEFEDPISQSGATWDIGINSPTNYGVIAFTGSATATLPDVLNVTLNNGPVLGLGDSFSIVDFPADTLGGSLTATNLPAEGASWQLNYGATNLSLVVTNLSVPQVSITSPANNAYLVAPSSILISASATSTNGVPIASVQFFQGSNLLGQVLSPPYNFSWSSVSPGLYTLSALATDANGAVAVSAPVNITVVPAGPLTTNYIWTGAVSADWFNAGNWNPVGVPGVLDNAIITNNTSPSPSLSGNASVNNVILSGGGIGGVGALTVTNYFLWTGGAISNALIIPTNATLVLYGAGTLGLSNATLLNMGTVDWLGGSLNGNAATIITNAPGGIWLAQSNYSISLGFSSSHGLFVNDGVVRKTTASSTTFEDMNFINNGTVDAQSGTIEFYYTMTAVIGAYHTLAGGTIELYGYCTNSISPSITGGGVTEFYGGTLTLLNDAPPALQLAGGTVTLGPAFQNAGAITNLTLSGASLQGTNTVTGVFNCASGTLFAGSLTVGPAALMTIGVTNGSQDVYLDNFNLVNAGEVIMQGVYLYGSLSSFVTNNNLWLLEPGTYYYSYYGEEEDYSPYMEDITFVNNGVLRQTAAGTSTIAAYGAFINNGLVDAEAGTIQLDGGGSFAGSYNTAAGAAIAFGGGTNVLNSLPNFTGLGQFTFNGGTLVMNNDIDPALQLLSGGNIVLGPAFQNAGAINNLTLQGATLSGTNTVTGVLNIQGGALNGVLTVQTNATLNFSPGTFTLQSGALTNFGSVFCTGNTDFYFDSSSNVFFVNNGLWLNLGYSDFYDDYYYYGYAPVTFINNGVFRQEGSETYFEEIAVNNNGLFDVQTGDLYFEFGGALGGTYNAASGAGLYLDGGTFVASLPPPIFTGAGVNQLSYGTVLLQNDQIPTLPLNSGTVMLGTNFQNMGAITNLTLGGATLAGTNLVSGTLTLGSGSEFNGVLTVLSNGLLVLSGSSDKYLYGSALINQGVVDWTGGELYCSAGIAITNNGIWLVETDNEFYNYGYYYSTNLFFNAGTFTKTTTTGVTTCYGISFLNAGTLDVESGSVSLAANYYNKYAQTGATLAFGVSAPNLAGQLNLPTNFNFDGTLLVNPLHGYTPSLGDSVTVITYGSAAGAFASLDLPDVSGGNTWNVDYGASGVNLSVVPAVTNFSSYLISGLVTDEGGGPISGVTVYAAQFGGSNLIQNGSFETPSSPAYSYTTYSPGSTNIPGWSVITATIDLGTASEFGPAYSEDGLQFFDPTGSSGTNGGVAQTFPTVPGTTYELIFYHGGASHYSLNNVLGVTIGTNYYTYDETDGSGANFDWRRVQILFTANSESTTVTFQGLNNFNSDDNWVDNVQVIAPGLGTALQAVTDEDGFYQIYVPNGTFQVGVGGLPGAGYNPVPAQDVVVSYADMNANFMATPASAGEFFTIAASVSPPGLGTVSGGGSGFHAGAPVTVVATQTNFGSLPYFFAGWTENGVLESTNLSYTFPALRSRVLVANFALPGLLVAVSNNPPADGIVSGAGLYTYGSNSVLTAFPYTGYKFVNWTEGGVVVGSSSTLTAVVLTNHFYVANYADANPTHAVTTATSPAGLGTVAGAATYTNGQTAILTAPAALTNSSVFYVFEGFTLNGTAVSSARSFSKSFSTFDPPALEYIAVYSAFPLLPQILGVADNYPNPIPATTGFRLTFQFDRSMSTVPAPLVVLTNSAPGAVQATVGTNGFWTTTLIANDTYQTPGITFGNYMDGTVQVLVSRVQDIYGHTLALTNATNLIVHSTPPPPPVVTISSPTNGARFSTTMAFPILASATSTNIISQVAFYANGALLGVDTASPYTNTVSSLPPGSYALTAVATDQAGLTGTSGVVHVTVSAPGTVLIDFQALDASGGPVEGANLSNYLAGYGVAVSNVTPAGESLAVEDDQVFSAGDVVKASSGDNFLAEVGPGNPVSYTLTFSSGYSSVSWVRPRLLAGTTGASLPAWTAYGYDSAGHVQDAVGVGEAAQASYLDIAAKPFTLTGTNIVAIQFVGNNGGGPLSTLPLNDLLLSTAAAATTLTASLTNVAGTVLTAPGTVVLSATVADSLAEVTNVDFYEGPDLLGSVAPSGGVAQWTLNDLAAQGYVFTAVASDSLGVVAESAPLALTVGAGADLQVINFDSLDTSTGSVSGVELNNYLASNGVTLVNVTGGTMKVNSEGLVPGGAVVASSPPNYFTEVGQGSSQTMAFTLQFGAPAAAPLRAFGFTRVGLESAAGGVVSHPQWEATAYDAVGVELGSVGEAMIVSGTNVPPQSFMLDGLPGDGIASVQFYSANSTSAALLDDLILYENGSAVANPLTVTLSPPVAGGAAPANIPLSASVSDSLGAGYYVSFYWGPNLLGTVNSSPYNFVWTNVPAGTYGLQAQVVDASGLTAFSSPQTITVGPGANSVVVDFGALAAGATPVTGTALSNYLAGFGMTLSNVTAGTDVAVESQGLIAGGGAVAASSPPSTPTNIVTQIGSSGTNSYTVGFAPWLANFAFTRPELLASPSVSHPAWQATAYDAVGVPLASVSEGQITSHTNVGARGFNLNGGGNGIASVQFVSESSSQTTFSGMVADYFVLTTNAVGASFPPAVAITNMGSNLPPLTAGVTLPLEADAVGEVGGVLTSDVSVSFYANGVMIGAPVDSPPYEVLWTNVAASNYVLTVVASNLVAGGVTRTPPPVSVSVSQGLTIVSAQPTNQTVGVGGGASFASVVIPGANANSVSYQWYTNASQLAGASGLGLTLGEVEQVSVPGYSGDFTETGATLTINQVNSGDAGNYTLTVSNSLGQVLTSSNMELTVVPAPTVSVSPSSNVTAPQGTPVELTSLVTGVGPFSWQWLRNGTPIAGQTGSNYVIPGLQNNSGSYQVAVGNQYSSSISPPTLLMILATNEIVESPTNTTFANRISINPVLETVTGNTIGAGVEDGDPTIIAGKPVGNLIWYTWTPSISGSLSLTTQGSDFDTLLGVYTGTNLDGLTSVAEDDDSGGYFTSLVTLNVTAGTPYQIAVGGFQGASGSVLLGMPAGTTFQAGSLPGITSQPTNQLAQAGNQVTLTVGATNATGYQWFQNGSAVPGATGGSLVIPNFQAGQVGLYYAQVTNSVGLVDSQQASLQIAAGAGAGNSAYDKFGDAVDLSSTNETAEAPAPAGGGDTRGFSVSQTFSTVGATKDAGEPAHCGQAGGSSQWYIYTAPANGTLHVTTAGSKFNTILAVYTGPGTNFASLIQYACGYTTNYQTEGQPDLAVPATNGVRYFIAVDGYNGAVGTAQLLVGLGAAPSLTLWPANQGASPGGGATFSADAQGSTNLYYQWQLNGRNVAGATNTFYTATNAGIYTVVVSNVVGVVTSPAAALTLIPGFPTLVLSPTDQTVSPGNSATFTVEATGSNTLYYQWQLNGGNLPGATNNSYTTANAGSYTVVVSNLLGVVTSAPPAVLTVQQAGPDITQQPASLTNDLGKRAEFSVRASAPGDNNKNDHLHYQWYFDNAPIKGQTSSNLVIAAVKWTNSGAYYVVVSNSTGATPSAVATLTVVDNTPPTVAFTKPAANNFVTLTNPLTVSGTASDRVEVTNVQVKVGTNEFLPAVGSNKWSYSADLVPGTNIITAQSVNISGVTNTTLEQRKVIYKVGWHLTLLTNGTGRITSSDGATKTNNVLVIGDLYKVTASPISRSGYLFSNWVSGTNLEALTNAASTPAYSFLMSTNLILQANFVTNPFPAAAGAYSGLFYPTNGLSEASSGFDRSYPTNDVTEANSGFIRATILSNSTGAYSAVLMLNGETKSISGVFDLNGQAHTNFTGVGKTKVGVQLNLALYPPGDQMTGTVSNAAAGWNSTIQADRAAFNSKTDPATNYAGRYTLFLPPSTNAPTDAPDGYGFAAISNSLGGNSTLFVTLAGGATPFTWSVPIAQDGSVPLYQSLYSGKGSLLGWILFTNEPPNTLSTNSWVNWIKTPEPRTLYPLGFTNLLTNLQSSPYTNAAGVRLLNLTNATLTLSSGNLAEPLTYAVTLTSSNTLVSDPTNHLLIKVNPKDGVLTVTFRPDPAKAATKAATGAVQQDQTNALGTFSGATESGTLILK